MTWYPGANGAEDIRGPRHDVREGWLIEWLLEGLRVQGNKPGHGIPGAPSPDGSVGVHLCVRPEEGGSASPSALHHPYPSPLPSRERASDPRPRVLDAGCGTGSMAAKLAARRFQVAAVDLEPGNVVVTQGKLRNNGLAGREAVADVTALPFRDGAFDAAVCGEVLEHLYADAAAVAELARVLRPGGILVASVPANAAYWNVDDVWAGHQRRYGQEELAALVESQGLTVQRIASFGYPMFRLYRRWAFLPYVRLTAGRRSRWREEGSPWRHTETVRNLALSAPVRFIVGWLLRLDRRFFGDPRGIGLLLRARKPATG